MKYTIDEIIACNPCEEWPRERVKQQFGNRHALTFEEIVTTCDVSRDDLIWLGIALLPAKEQRLFACWCVREFCWDLLQDERSRLAVDAAERYAHGDATCMELDGRQAAAWHAARAAAWHAASGAARAARAARAASGAASAAAWAASSAAAWAAARAASSAAAWAASSAAAWAAAQAASLDGQLAELRRIHREGSLGGCHEIQ